MRVRIRAKKTGGYRITAILGHGATGSEIRKVYSKPTKKEADALAAQLLERAALGTYSSNTKTTFAAAAERWLEGKNTIRPHTRLFYGDILKNHILPGLGPLKLGAIGPDQVEDLMDAVAAKGLSPKMVHHIFATLRVLFNWAVKRRHIGVNPCALVDPPNVPRKETPAWDAEQAARYLIAAREGRLFPLLYLIVATGMRRGEALALRWSDIDLLNGRVRVMRAVTFPKGKASLGETKNYGSIRMVALSPSTVEVLRQHRGNVVDMSGERIETDRLVFASRNGTPIHTSTLARAHNKAVAQAGVPRITIHALRHTHASLLAAEDVPIKVTQERMGHANVQTTLAIYTHTAPGMQGEAAAAFDRAISRENDNWAQNGHAHRKK